MKCGYETIVALLLVGGIVIVGMWLKVDGIKEIALTLGGGLVGWLGKSYVSGEKPT